MLAVTGRKSSTGHSPHSTLPPPSTPSVNILSYSERMSCRFLSQSCHPPTGNGILTFFPLILMHFIWVISMCRWIWMFCFIVHLMSLPLLFIIPLSPCHSPIPSLTVQHKPCVSVCHFISVSTFFLWGLIDYSFVLGDDSSLYMLLYIVFHLLSSVL